MPHARTVTLPDGSALAVRVAGGGPPLVMLHAFPLDGRMWAAQEPLAGMATLVVPDQRGFGGSAAAGPPASIEQLADDAVAVLDGLGIGGPATFCGCSMGGYAAQHVAIRHPERVRAIVLVDTKLEADTPAARAARGDLAANVRRLGPGIVAEAMVPRLLAAPAGPPAAGRAAMEASLREMIVAQPVETIAGALGLLGARPDTTAGMRRAMMPALLVVGAEDAITPPDCLARAEAIMRTARLVVIPRAGHMVPLEAPTDFNAAVAAFLRSLDGRAAAAGVVPVR
jgi:pimeloyl-ACP methyl ester carboxylesterase